MITKHKKYLFGIYTLDSCGDVSQGYLFGYAVYQRVGNVCMLFGHGWVEEDGEKA